MKTKRLTALLATITALATLATAETPEALTINSHSRTAPGLEVYRASGKTYRVTFTDGTTARDVTGETPVMVWYTNQTAAAVSTSSYSVVTAASGIVDFTFTAADMNYTAGRYYYAAGVTDSESVPKVLRQGRISIIGEPWATGVPATTWTTNWNLNMVTFTGTLPNANLDTDLSALATPSAQTLIYTDTNGAYQALSFAGGASKTVTIKADESAPELTTPANGGDMLKATYDTDADDVVDNAEALKGNTNTPLYAYTETDPVFTNWLSTYNESDPVYVASIAYGITGTDTSHWATAYGWGDHSGLYDTDGTASGLMAALVLASPYVADLGLFTNAVNTAITNDYATGAEGDLAATATQPGDDWTNTVSGTAAATVESGAAAGATAMQDLVDDTTPTLGGNLDANSKSVSDLVNIEAHTDEAGSTVTLGNGRGHIVAGKVGNAQPATVTIGDSSYGVNVSGYIGDNASIAIGEFVRGSSFRGTDLGSVVFGDYANGSLLMGTLGASTAGATNGTGFGTGAGNILLFTLDAGEGVNATGNASIGLGAVAITDNECIVAGDGGTSNGDGSITATGGFHGNGSSITNVDALTLGGESASAFEDADAAIAKTDEAETLTANWVNTNYPWADNEVADTITIGAGSTVAGSAITASTVSSNAMESATDTAYRTRTVNTDTHLVTQRWDYVYAESVGLCVGPAQPSSYITNLVYGTTTQQVEFLAFDDTTEEYTGAQTWQTWPTWNGNITVRGSSWYADATPGDVTWTIHYVGDGLTPATVDLTYTGAAATETNLDHWAVSTNLTGITAGDTVTYWISRDPADDPTGDVYLRKMAIGWGQE